MAFEKKASRPTETLVEGTAALSVEAAAQDSCPICGSLGRRRLGLRGDRPIPELLAQQSVGYTVGVFACLDCRHVYCDPVPFPEELSKRYSEVAGTYFRGSEETRVDGATSLMKTLSSLVGSAGRLLDVGCGTGQLLKAASEEGWDAVGIEPTAEFATRARENGLCVHEGYLDEDFVAQRPFDAVTLMAVLEHVPRPVEMLTRAHSLLRKGGVVIVEVPNAHRPEAWLLDKLLRLKGQPWTVRTAPLQSPFHLSEFSKGSLAKALGVAGFHIHRLRAQPGHAGYPVGQVAARAISLVERVGGCTGHGLNLFAIGLRKT